MSRLSPERLLVGLAPAAVTVGKASVSCDPAYGNEPWQGAIAALKSLPIEGRSRVTVVLANHFVRYAIVPWSDALGTAQEEDAYLRHHFAKIHGERAKSWALRSTESAAGAPRLASAIDADLLAEIRSRFPKGGSAKLVSVQPQLMAKFNAWRGAVPAAGAWLVLAESDRACVALHAQGRWRAVQNAKGAWLDLLDRERHRVEGELPDFVLLAGASPPGDGDWKFHQPEEAELALVA